MEMIMEAKKKNIYIRTGFSLFLVVVMVGVSELLGEREIIFPEIAALTVGAMISEKMPWKTDRPRMFILMSVSAFMGWGLALIDFVPVWVRIVGGFCICAVFLSAAHCSMLPMISASVLPVLMKCSSIVYPVSVIIMTGLVILMQLFLEKNGLRSKNGFIPEKQSYAELLLHWLMLLVLLGAVSAGALICGFPFMIAPPLIVGMTELSDRKSPVRRSAAAVFAVTVLCAAAGGVARYGICIAPGLPLTAGAAAAFIMTAVILILTGKYFPPAAALSILPFLLGENMMLSYVLQVLAGAAMLYGGAILSGRLEPGLIRLASRGKKHDELLL